MQRRVRMGMVGGGEGAFIGGVHRMAARLDGQVEFVCGALSSDPGRARASGAALGLAPERAYGSWEEMLAKEAALAPGERMEFVSIVTPNHLHHPVARAALEAGFCVLSDKPATRDLAEAKDLARIVARTGLLYGLTHTYTGYPMVKHAREVVRSGRLGSVRKVAVSYEQDWLATRVEATPGAGGHKQASWRNDPALAGSAGCMGDIGTHAANLAEFVTGLAIREVAADLTSFVPGRALDDDGSVLLRFGAGASDAKGVLHASQVSVGCENDVAIRVSCERGGVSWRHADPNTLLVSRLGGPTEVHRTAQGGLGEEAAGASRLPGGHPEGYIEAFANLYRAFAADVRARNDGDASSVGDLGYPTIEDGVRGMAFVEAVVASSAGGGVWRRVEG